jgi:UDP-N-acetylmuramoyl-L-alanyl-D-glutamate--2,6-diaminopimelate ligase
MRAAGVPEQAIKRGIDAVKSVPGRMDWIEGEPRVLIDYAVTPDALERLYKDVRQQTRGKVYAVLGACGMRDRGKRPDMARVVAQYADELVLTREDPWTEDEEQIFADLEKGLLGEAGVESTGREETARSLSTSLYALFARPRPVPPAGGRAEINDSRTAHYGAKLRPVSSRLAMNKSFWKRIVDRREAIKYCLEKAGPEDVVVITGKGAETGMAVGKKVVPWNDKAVVLELFEELSGVTSKSQILMTNSQSSSKSQ